jgi:hypothetical protein
VVSVTDPYGRILGFPDRPLSEFRDETLYLPLPSKSVCAGAFQYTNCVVQTARDSSQPHGHALSPSQVRVLKTNSQTVKALLSEGEECALFQIIAVSKPLEFRY